MKSGWIWSGFLVGENVYFRATKEQNNDDSIWKSSYLRRNEPTFLRTRTHCWHVEDIRQNSSIHTMTMLNLLHLSFAIEHIIISPSLITCNIVKLVLSIDFQWYWVGVADADVASCDGVGEKYNNVKKRASNYPSGLADKVDCSGCVIYRLIGTPEVRYWVQAMKWRLIFTCFRHGEIGLLCVRLVLSTEFQRHVSVWCFCPSYVRKYGTIAPLLTDNIPAKAIFLNGQILIWIPVASHKRYLIFITIFECAAQAPVFDSFPLSSSLFFSFFLVLFVWSFSTFVDGPTDILSVWSVR